MGRGKDGEARKRENKKTGRGLDEGLSESRITRIKGLHGLGGMDGGLKGNRDLEKISNARAIRLLVLLQGYEKDVCIAVLLTWHSASVRKSRLLLAIDMPLHRRGAT